jgi:hypothetical protein
VTSPVKGELLLLSIDAAGIAFPFFSNAQLPTGSSAVVEANAKVIFPTSDQVFKFEMKPPLCVRVSFRTASRAEKKRALAAAVLR